MLPYYPQLLKFTPYLKWELFRLAYWNIAVPINQSLGNFWRSLFLQWRESVLPVRDQKQFYPWSVKSPSSSTRLSNILHSLPKRRLWSPVRIKTAIIRQIERSLPQQILIYIIYVDLEIWSALVKMGVSSASFWVQIIDLDEEAACHYLNFVVLQPTCDQEKFFLSLKSVSRILRTSRQSVNLEHSRPLTLKILPQLTEVKPTFRKLKNLTEQ